MLEPEGVIKGASLVGDAISMNVPWKKDENALLTQLQSTMGGGMFQKSLRAARLDFAPGEDAGDGEAIYRGYLQASLLSVVSAAFLHPITERRLMPPSLSGTLACNHRVGVYDWAGTSSHCLPHSSHSSHPARSIRFA